jgi:hypothetical protein
LRCKESDEAKTLFFVLFGHCDMGACNCDFSGN